MKLLQGLKPSKTVVLNIEANGLNPKEIWCATCIDVDTGEEHAFRRPDLDQDAFLDYMSDVAVSIGHNILNYDMPVLVRLTKLGTLEPCRVVDTLVVSRILDFNRSGGHSLAAWAPTLKVEKTQQPPWDVFSEALVDHSMQNCRLTVALYKRFLPYLESKRWKGPIELEHFIAEELRLVRENGFHFSLDEARKLCYNISREVENFDKQILTAFPPRVRLIREVHPRLTKFGTLNRNDFRWVEGGDLSDFTGGPFSLIDYEPFNPGSPLQIVERMNEAGWKPVEKTKSHLQALRDKNQEKIARFATVGWKVSEANLDTLPETAPPAAKLLATRIKHASRVRVLNEWIENCREDHRIHGSINHIGAWTHRCSHDKPNTGNIPRDDALFGRELRSLWCVDDGYLVGVDAESIQLRVLAHYIRDKRFTESLLSGSKEDGTDPHSLNKQALGSPCRSRNAAKTFIYAWLLGAGIAKVAEILECDYGQAKQADSDFITFYPGLKLLKDSIIPKDASRGYFEGFDGRFIRIFGDDEPSRRHFTLAGYLQAGEVLVMKTGMSIWLPRLKKEKVPFKLVNFVHDEWQTQVYGDYELAKYVAEVQADSIREAGERLNLNCPMAGSILSGHGGLAIGQNWYETH